MSEAGCGPFHEQLVLFEVSAEQIALMVVATILGTVH